MSKDTLIDASGAGDLESVHTLLASESDVRQINAEGKDALITASEHGHYHVLLALLAVGADVGHANVYSRTALMDAAQGCQLEIIDELLDNGADGDQLDRQGLTVLQRAIIQGDSPVENLLRARLESSIPMIKRAPAFRLFGAGVNHQAPDHNLSKGDYLRLSQ